MVKEYLINDIESLTEQQAQELAIDSKDYKGYKIYFVDFPGYFGYSRLVFKNGHHIYYANDYELHHKNKTHEQLQKMYTKGLKYKLFRPADLKKVKDYDDYNRKIQWLMNLFAQEYERYTAFVIRGTEEEKELERKIKEENLTFSGVCICYFKDKEPAIKAAEYLDTLHKAKEESENSFDYWVAAFKHELFNHEYSINWQGNYDVFSCFGNIHYKGDDLYSREEVEDYMKQLNFNDMHRKAWNKALTEYSKVAANY